jgi:hypothetical protein
MTIKEFRTSVLDSELKDEWLSLEIPIKLTFDGFEYTFKGVVSFYEFIYKNKSGWDRILKTNGTNKNFEKCQQYFSKIKAETLSYDKKYSGNSFLNTLESIIRYDFSSIRI